MSVTIKDVEHIAELARLEFDEKEKEKLTHELNDILKYIEKLNELDTSNVEPLSHVIELSNVFRDDVVNAVNFTRGGVEECTGEERHAFQSAEGDRMIWNLRMANSDCRLEIRTYSSQSTIFQSKIGNRQLKILGIIPSRYASQRLPAKSLADIHGKPMVQRVYERAKQSRLLTDVIIATDDERIESAVKKFGGKSVMTPSTIQSGSDSVAFVARSLERGYHCQCAGRRAVDRARDDRSDDSIAD